MRIQWEWDRLCDGLMETQIYVGQYLVHARLDFKYRRNGVYYV